MYKKKKFRPRPFDEILEDFKLARRYYPRVGRIFLADGNAMCLAADKLLQILETASHIFPECERIGLYSRASDILRKSDVELAKLRETGLGIVYIGAESGSEEVLRRINKGETPAQISEGVQKAENVGIETSVTFVSGLGGKELLTEHAVETGKMIGRMGASYVGLLTLILEPGAPMYDDELAGRFLPLSAREVLEELALILAGVDCKKDCLFRSNHPSNLINLRGTLPQDKDMLLTRVKDVIEVGNISDAYLRNRRL